MSFLTGGSKSTSESGNKNLGLINSTYSPAMDLGNNAGSLMSSLLMGTSNPGTTDWKAYEAADPGIARDWNNGTASHDKFASLDDYAKWHYDNYGQNEGRQLQTTPGSTTSGQDAFNTFKDNTGFQFLLDSGRKAVEGSQAAKGMLNSGSTLKGLTKFGEDLGNTYVQQFLDNLLKQQQTGLQAGQLVAGAGQYSKGTQSSTPGILGSVGSIMSGLGAMGVSDRRLKKNIVKLDEFEDGLGIYSFEYTFEPGKQIGVMADEVKELRPWALGPVIAGEYMTVNYGAL